MKYTGPTKGTVKIEMTVAGTVAQICPLEEQLINTMHASVGPLGVDKSHITLDCAAASVLLGFNIIIPAGSTLSVTQVNSHLSQTFSSAAAATAFFQALGLVVISAPTIAVNGGAATPTVVTSTLPLCGCNVFVNGWTTDNAGMEGCARADVVHGLAGKKTVCYPPQRPYIPHLDDGCTSDSYRCLADYTAPTFPTCQCDEFANQAYLSHPNGLCQKSTHKGNVCYARNYVGDKKHGGWEFYGCPQDTFRCS